MNSLRHILLACLALTLLVTSSAMAVSRVQTDSAGSIIICTGNGPISVAVDADGQPVGPHHICPDCLQSVLDVVSPTPAQAKSLTLTTSKVAQRAFAVAKAQFPAQQRHARAPPLV